MIESNHPQSTQIFITPNNINGIGTAGFILALLAIVLCWIPILGQILWITGLILSFVGIFKKPRGLAIAGLTLSLIGIILFILFFASIVGASLLAA